MSLESSEFGDESNAQASIAPSIMPLSAPQRRDDSAYYHTTIARSKMAKAVDMVKLQELMQILYSPIDSNKDIRILRIQAGKPGQKLFGTLIPASQIVGKGAKLDTNGTWNHFSYDILESSRSGIEPPFGKYEDEINIYYSSETQRPSEALGRFNNYGVLHISRQLKEAITQIRQASRDVHIWCEQICINPNDLAERSVHLARTGRIYEEARAVRIWLGPGTALSGEALAFLLRILDPAYLRRVSSPKDVDFPKWLLLFDCYRELRPLLLEPLVKHRKFTVIIHWGSQRIVGTDFVDALIVARTTILRSAAIQTLAKSKPEQDFPSYRVLEDLARNKPQILIRPGSVLGSQPGIFPVSWKCRCGRTFSCDLSNTTREVAEDLFLKLDWDYRMDGPITNRCMKWIYMDHLIWVPILDLLWATILRPSSQKSTSLGNQQIASDKDRGLAAWLSWSMPHFIRLGYWMVFAYLANWARTRTNRHDVFQRSRGGKSGWIHYFPYEIKYDWLEDLIWTLAPGLLTSFSWESQRQPLELALLEEGIDLGSRGDFIDMQNSRFQNLQSGAAGRVEEELEQLAVVEDRVFVCLYKRIDEEWRLRHVKVPREEAERRVRNNPLGTEIILSRQPSMNHGMDQALFNAMRRKLLGKTYVPTSQSLSMSLKRFVRAIDWPWRCPWSQWWDRLCPKFNPLVISGLQFWEFKLNPAPKLVDPIEKNKLPDEDDTSFLASDEWDYSALSGDELVQFKGLLSGSYLLHLLKFPDHAKPDSPIWLGLPKKIRSKLVNNRNIQIPGWGFQIDYEWNSKAFLVLTSPIIIFGFILATALCVKFNWPVSAGVTLALAPVTIVTYINTMIGGITKQRGLSK